ncbi:MAG: hypothetical protein CMH24_03905 [Nitrosomonadales bacterium]|nr:hypothetical protein [Nitrosomonadales bacterium]
MKSLKNIKLPSNRKFGFFFTLIFALIGIYFFIDGPNSTSYILFTTSTLFFLITLIKPNALLPLNKLWMQFGLLLGTIINPIILGIIFFGLFTPMGLLMKLFGRDELRLKIINNRKSYWKKRKLNDVLTDAFRHQF